MQKKLFILLCSVIGNALGTALMTNTTMGLTVWGSAAKNASIFFNISFGTAFIVLAIAFFAIALMINRHMKPIEMLMSLIFLILFGLLSDLFIFLIPDFSNLHYMIRLAINIIGLVTLMFSIALHLKILIAVHPCDIFLYQMQIVFKNDTLGTYATYSIVFLISICFGLLSGAITGIGVGTLLTLCFSGVLIRFFNRTLLKNI
jgi:uncharacterized membrane protein YczE